MDPHANVRKQRELARGLIASYHRPPHEVDGADAAELAEHVLALDDWRLNGGYDPYEDRSKRT